MQSPAHTSSLQQAVPTSPDHKPWWKCPPALASPCTSAPMQPGAAGAHPPVLCVGRSKEEGWQACHQVGMPAAGSFPAPRPREVPQLTVKHLHGHSCSGHLEIIKVSPSINPTLPWIEWEPSAVQHPGPG